MQKVLVPPGGFLGWASQSVATQALLARSNRPSTRRKTTRRKKRTTKRAPARRRKTTARRKTARRTKRPAYMVKGSAAAKRRMAQLRKMRRKK